MRTARSTDFAALARLLAITSGSAVQAAVIAESTKAPPAVTSVLKASVGAGNLSDPAFAGSLDGHGEMVAAFIEALRSRSVFVRLLESGLVRMPLRTRAAVLTADASAYVVGEGAAIPVSALSLAGPTLDQRKAAAMIVVTSELLRSVSPAARLLLDNSLKAAVADAIDAKFLDIAADGATADTASGTDADAALADLKAMLAAVNTTGSGSLFWVAAVDVANAAATLTGAGGFVFPAMSPVGGEMLNLPALVSNAIPAGQLMLVDATGLAGEIETVTVSTAEHATLQLDSAPNSPPNASTVVQSLWQSNKAAILATAYFGAERVRSNAVAVLDGIAWGA